MNKECARVDCIKVRIIKSTEKIHWYNDKIGNFYPVYQDFRGHDYYFIDSTGIRSAIVLQECKILPIWESGIENKNKNYWNNGDDDSYSISYITALENRIKELEKDIKNQWYDHG